MDRQSVLERMGWIFTRIRSSEFLRNPARAMKPYFEKLQMLEIPPTGNSAGAEPAESRFTRCDRPRHPSRRRTPQKLVKNEWSGRSLFLPGFVGGSLAKAQLLVLPQLGRRLAEKQAYYVKFHAYDAYFHVAPSAQAFPAQPAGEIECWAIQLLF